MYNGPMDIYLFVHINIVIYVCIIYVYGIALNLKEIMWETLSSIYNLSLTRHKLIHWKLEILHWKAIKCLLILCCFCCVWKEAQQMCNFCLELRERFKFNADASDARVCICEKQWMFAVSCMCMCVHCEGDWRETAWKRKKGPKPNKWLKLNKKTKSWWMPQKCEFNLKGWWRW